MLLKNVYEKVTFLGGDMPPAKFVTCFNSFSQYLLISYGEKFVCQPESAYADAVTLDSDVPVRPSYESAYVDNILGIAIGDTGKQADAVAKAALAYKKEWNAHAKGKKLKKEAWY